MQMILNFKYDNTAGPSFRAQDLTSFWNTLVHAPEMKEKWRDQKPPLLKVFYIKPYYNNFALK